MPKGYPLIEKTLKERAAINARISESVSKDWFRKTPAEVAVFGAKMSRSQKAYFGSLSVEEKVRLSKNSFNSLGAHEKVTEAQKAWWASLSVGERLAYGDKISESMEEVWRNRTLENRKAINAKMVEGRRVWWSGLSEREKDKWLRHCNFIGPQEGQTQGETSLDLYLQDRFPGESKYNGCVSTEERVTVGRRIPDFININGKKEVISVFGPRHLDGDEAVEIAHYGKFGYKCTVVWSYDCFDWKGLDKIFGVESPTVEEGKEE